MIKRFFAERPFSRRVLVLVTGTTLSQAIAALAAPVLTRLYSPGEFGLLTVYIAITSIFVLFGTLQYENAITLPRDDEDAINLVALSFIILLGMGVITGILLSAGKYILLNGLKAGELMPFLWLVPLSLVGTGTYNILNRWNMRRLNFTPIAKTKVTQSLGMIGTQFSLGWLSPGPLGLLLGDTVGRMGGSGRLLYLLYKQDKPVLRCVTRQGIRLAAIRFKRFPLISGGSALLKELCEQMPALFLVTAFGPRVVGLFMLVQRILGLPLSLIGYSVGNVYMAEASCLIQNNTGTGISALYIKTLRQLFWLSLPLLFALSLIAPWLFPALFGLQWLEAATYLRILAPMYLLQFLSIPLSTTLYVLERQDLQLLRELIRFTLLFLAALLVIGFNLPALAAMGLLSLSGSLAFVVYGAASWVAIKQNLNSLKIAGK